MKMRINCCIKERRLRVPTWNFQFEMDLKFLLFCCFSLPNRVEQTLPVEQAELVPWSSKLGKSPSRVIVNSLDSKSLNEIEREGYPLKGQHFV